MTIEKKIWANSGGSHLMKPVELFQEKLPPDPAERMPRGPLEEDGQFGDDLRRRQEFCRKVTSRNGRWSIPRPVWASWNTRRGRPTCDLGLMTSIRRE